METCFFSVSAFHLQHQVDCFISSTVSAMTAQMMAILAHSAMCGPFKFICLAELGFRPACTLCMILTPCLSALVAYTAAVDKMMESKGEIAASQKSFLYFFPCDYKQDSCYWIINIRITFRSLSVCKGNKG
jgi:hypothetical protein